MSKKTAELHVLLRLQAHATAIGMYFLISKGLLDKDEYNEYLKNAEKNLKENLGQDALEAEVDFKALIEEAFSGLYIPDNVGANLFTPKLFN